MDLIPNNWKHLLKTETSQKKNAFYCFKALPSIIPIKTLGKWRNSKNCHIRYLLHPSI